MPNKTLDQVLAAYADAAPAFDAEILKTFVTGYPAYAEELMRYAQLQLVHGVQEGANKDQS